MDLPFEVEIKSALDAAEIFGRDVMINSRMAAIKAKDQITISKEIRVFGGTFNATWTFDGKAYHDQK